MGRTKRLRSRKKCCQEYPKSPKASVAVCLDSREDHVQLFKYMFRNGWKNETFLKIGDFALTGRGVYSTRNLEANDILIEIPLDILISIETIEKDSEFRMLLFELFPEVQKCIDTQCLFAFYVLFLKHRNRCLPYLDSIPGDFSVPYFCTDTELRGLPIEIRDKVHSQRDLIERQHLLFQLRLKNKVCSCCGRRFEPVILNKVSFEWAFFAVNSRSVFLNHECLQKPLAILDLLRDTPNLALAPFLDMLNHSSSFGTMQNVQHRKSPASLRKSTYQLYTKTPVKKYEQIFISYGALDNYKLITEYGFSFPSNKFDVLSYHVDEFEEIFGPMPRKIKIFLKSHAIDEHLNIGRECGFSHNFLLLVRLAYELKRDASIFGSDEFLNKFIYAEAVILTEELRDCVFKLVEYKIKKLNCSLNYFNDIKMGGKLSHYAMAYVLYLEDTIRWLEGLEVS